MTELHPDVPHRPLSGLVATVRTRELGDGSLELTTGPTWIPAAVIFCGGLFAVGAGLGWLGDSLQPDRNGGVLAAFGAVVAFFCVFGLLVRLGGVVHPGRRIVEVRSGWRFRPPLRVRFDEVRAVQLLATHGKQSPRSQVNLVLRDGSRLLLSNGPRAAAAEHLAAAVARRVGCAVLDDRGARRERAPDDVDDATAAGENRRGAGAAPTRPAVARLGPRWEHVSGGGCLTLFGLIFAGAGFLSATAPWWAERAGATTEGPEWVAHVVGALFMVVGLALAFGRRGLVVEPRAGTLTRWWGFLVPFRSQSWSLAEVRHVRLSREVRRSNKSSYVCFPVRVVLRTDSLEIEAPRDADAGRAKAEELAKALGAALRDESGGGTVEREAGTLDESLRERWRRTGEVVERPARPASCSVSVAESPVGVTVTIPPRDAKAGRVLAGTLLGVGLTAVTWTGFILFFIGVPDEAPFRWFVLAFALAPPSLTLVAGLGRFLHRRRLAAEEERIVLTSQELVVERSEGGRSRRNAVPVAELEELALGRDDVRARSDRRRLTFAARLPRDERRYVLEVLRHALTRL